ncbi:hypothetical protein C0J52_04869 [Blattella germanica]|nr:hypothetical protein C0J52_04869 [Blattella germanica]PSN54730.1 hypothetical protein C0J52_04869 [Blattella germanica]
MANLHRLVFSFSTNASVLSCNNVGRCHLYRRLLTYIPSLRAHDLAHPCHHLCAVAPVGLVVGSQRSRKTVTMFSKQKQRTWIKIQCARGHTAKQCHRGLQEAALLFRTVARWVATFRTIEEVKQATKRSLCTINRFGNANEIQQLPHRWEHVVHNSGDYIEGL